jgi:hypothetical protein
MSNKFDPPDVWLSRDDETSPYNLDDFDGPNVWPPPGAIEVCRADGSGVNAATLEFDEGIVIHCTWTEDTIHITYRVTPGPNSGGTVWVGYGPMAEDQCHLERWQSLGEATPEEWCYSETPPALRPTEERWWLQALVEKTTVSKEVEKD